MESVNVEPGDMGPRAGPDIHFILPSLGGGNPVDQDSTKEPEVGDFPRGAVPSLLSFLRPCEVVDDLFDDRVGRVASHFVQDHSLREMERILVGVIFAVGERTVNTGDEVFPFLFLDSDVGLRQRTGPFREIPEWLATESTALDVMYLAVAMSTAHGSIVTHNSLRRYFESRFADQLRRLEALGEGPVLDVVKGLSCSQVEAVSVWFTLRTLWQLAGYAGSGVYVQWTERVRRQVVPEIERLVFGAFRGDSE